MRRIVDLAWLILVACMAATWPWLPGWVGRPGEALPRGQYLALMLGLALVCPWVVARGTVLLARHAPVLVNLPNKDYWLAPGRREATLVQLDGRLAALGLGLTVLLAGVHAQVLLQAHPDWPQPPASAWAAGVIAPGVGFLGWLMAFLRHFSRLPPVMPRHPPRRRHSRNDELVWRESQPMWLMFPILACAVLFILRIDASITAAEPAKAASPPIIFALMTCGLVTLLLGRLVTEVRGDSLRWHYGWLGWPRWRVDLDDIVAVEPARSRWTEGWGIRVTGEGMLYNSSGTHAVRLVLRDGRRLRLGSRQPQRLLDALQARIDQG